MTQTILYDAALQETGVYGNCLQAAIASLLDRPLDSVPHFSLFLWWPGAMELWARGEGLTVRTCAAIDLPTQGSYIVGGKSVRGVDHVVVVRNGVVWDPHPSRNGLVSVDDLTWFEEWDHTVENGCPLCGREAS